VDRANTNQPSASHNTTQSAESKLVLQSKSIKAAIASHERDLNQIKSKCEKHLSNIAELEAKILKEKNELAAAQEKDANLQVLIMEKMVELQTVAEAIAEEESNEVEKEKEKEKEKQRKAAEVEKQKEEFERRAQEQRRLASEEPAMPKSPKSEFSVASYAQRFQEPPKSEFVKRAQEPNSKDLSLSELEKEQERLNRTIAKDPSKQPVKVVVAPLVKPAAVVVQPKAEENYVKTPSLLETLMEKEGTPKTFRWETWDALDKVSLMGSFTNWQLVDLPRIKGVFTVTLPLSSGTHFYRYKVNNKFELEKNQPKAIASDGEYATKIQI